jgi:hypothetical protein
VTCLYLDRFRAHALRHEPLEIGIDRPVFRRHSVPSSRGGSSLSPRPAMRQLGDRRAQNSLHGIATLQCGDGCGILFCIQRSSANRINRQLSGWNLPPLVIRASHRLSPR